MCLQVYPGQPTSGSYAMSSTGVQGYTVPVEQIPAQQAPRLVLHSQTPWFPNALKHYLIIFSFQINVNLSYFSIDCNLH